MAELATFDLLVIGGGPAGYIGAIRAAQLGKKVACVERDRLGGVCLNWGCIPTKALLASAEFYAHLKHGAGAMGIEADNVRHNWEKVIGRSRGVANTLNKGVHGLFKKNKVTHFQGHAKIIKAGRGSFGPGSGHRVQVFDAPGGNVTQEIEAKTILIATGAVPRSIPGVTFDGEKIIDAKAAMTLPTQPAKLIIIGAGPIGMEFAYFYNAFGTQVTVIEMLDRLMPNEDAEVSAAVFKSFCKQGIDCRPGTRTLGVTVTATGVEVTVAPAGAPGEQGAAPDPATVQSIIGDKVLVAVGVRGRYDGLFEPSLGIELFKDHIKVDKTNYQTSVPGIYAVGDVIGPPWLAHVASEEAIVCVERLCGHHPPDIDYSAIPGCTYCSPQVASLGMTEAALQKAGIEYKIGKFPFLASGKAQALGHTEGFVKILSDPKHGEILGVHMVGENVTELIAELGLAKAMEATTDEIINTIHAHPTLSEAVHESALGTQGRMLNF